MSEAIYWHVWCYIIIKQLGKSNPHALDFFCLQFHAHFHNFLLPAMLQLWLPYCGHRAYDTPGVPKYFFVQILDERTRNRHGRDGSWSIPFEKSGVYTYGQQTVLEFWNHNTAGYKSEIMYAGVGWLRWSSTCMAIIGDYPHNIFNRNRLCVTSCGSCEPVMVMVIETLQS